MLVINRSFIFCSPFPPILVFVFPMKDFELCRRNGRATEANCGVFFKSTAEMSVEQFGRRAPVSASGFARTAEGGKRKRRRHIYLIYRRSGVSSGRGFGGKLAQRDSGKGACWISPVPDEPVPCRIRCRLTLMNERFGNEAASFSPRVCYEAITIQSAAAGRYHL